ncbi:unnamed protein product [Caenorhabditis angaria]|uniref:Partial AB-hydrolase lipase domain-containing protein n=1 Tax=Caenorhabditis angaria TaxID=860376 RepID=A0A9P1J010_9PELO|nr:unnamed protein product [Caenorhabditis angaria]
MLSSRDDNCLSAQSNLCLHENNVLLNIFRESQTIRETSTVVGVTRPRRFSIKATCLITHLLSFHFTSFRSRVFLGVFLLFFTVFCHDPDPEMHETTPQIIMRWGYPAMIYDVTTDDGYILELHRIPYGKTNVTWPGGKRPVVFMQHGLECASDNWIVNLPNQSAGFLFADAGFDVWLGNFRGNTYSKKHKNLKPSHSAFWEWSWDEMAKYDLPAMINKALEVSGQDHLYYMGHSQGTLTMFSRLSNDTDGFGDKIRQFHALAPVGAVKHIKGLLKFFADYFAPEFDGWFDVFGSGEFTPNNWIMKLAADSICAGLKVESDLCDNILFLIAGPESNQLNQTRVPIYVSHTPAGTSTQNIVHWLQMVRHGGTPMYDYGTKGNKKHYGQSNVPAYDFTNIKRPMYLYWGDSDWLADPTDIQEFLLPHLNPSYIVANNKLADYNHLDFIWGLRAPDDIYKPIIDLVRKDVLNN